MECPVAMKRIKMKCEKYFETNYSKFGLKNIFIVVVVAVVVFVVTGAVVGTFFLLLKECSCEVSLHSKMSSHAMLKVPPHAAFPSKSIPLNQCLIEKSLKTFSIYFWA